MFSGSAAQLKSIPVGYRTALCFVGRTTYHEKELIRMYLSLLIFVVAISLKLNIIKKIQGHRQRFESIGKKI
jgi:hypothetical protein